MHDSPDDPGDANAWDSSSERGAFGGGPSRGASAITIHMTPFRPLLVGLA